MFAHRFAPTKPMKFAVSQKLIFVLVVKLENLSQEDHGTEWKLYKQWTVFINNMHFTPVHDMINGKHLSF